MRPWGAICASSALFLSASVGLAADSGFQAREQQLQEQQQQELDHREQIEKGIPFDRRVLVDYGAFVTFSYLTLTNAAGTNQSLRQYDGIAFARLDLNQGFEFFLRGRTGYKDFSSGDSFDGRGDEVIDSDLERGFVRFDLSKYRSANGFSAQGFNVTAQAGRDLVYWANGLVLGRTLDGIQAEVRVQNLSLSLLGGVTPTRTVDFDPSRPAFDHNTRRGFFGAMATADIHNQHPFAYFLTQRDVNGKDADTRGLIDTRYNYSSYYVGLGSSGTITDSLQYAVEGVYEFGNTLSNSFFQNADALIPVFQTRDDVSAIAVNGKIEYAPESVYRPRLSAELTYASGDSDRIRTNSTFGGNLGGTEDHAFNAFGLTNTGLALAPAVSNLIAVRFGGNVAPFPNYAALRKLQVGTDVFFLAKAKADAPIDELTADHRYLGWEPDLYANWQVTSDITLALRYGAFFPNDDAFGDNTVRQFFYGGVTFAF